MSGWEDPTNDRDVLTHIVGEYTLELYLDDLSDLHITCSEVDT